MGNPALVEDTYDLARLKIWCPKSSREGERYTASELTKVSAVTHFRGVIERVNRRLKRMAYLRNRQQNTSMGYSRAAWRVSAILCNLWFSSLARDREPEGDHEQEEDLETEAASE